jgi:superkiller protein 3
MYFLICNRELSEKMSLGALILEPVNKDFWVTLGSVSSDLALKQHSFIRSLHLDMSLSEAWAYLGKVLLLKQHLIDYATSR